MKVIFEHPVTGELKEAPLGFSWTTLIFGVFVPLIRGDWKWAIIMLLVGLVTLGISLLVFPLIYYELVSLVTLGISWIVFAFIYNKLWAKELVTKGFKVKDVIGGDIRLAEMKIGLKLEKLQDERS